MENDRDTRWRGGRPLPPVNRVGALRSPPFRVAQTAIAGDGKSLSRPSVSLDSMSVRRQEAGLDSAGERRVLYSIALAGPVDDRWRRAFRLVQIEDTGLFRYRLEMESDTISFTCSERSAGARFAVDLRQLDLLVARVNQKAALLD